MARIRTIKPGFFINEAVASLPYEWRLLFVGLWTQADREGRLEDRPMRLKAALFPYDDLNISDGLGCLTNAGLIIRYDRGDQKLIAIPTWAKHQQPHIRESVSDLPPPQSSTVPAPCEPVGSGKGTGREQEGVHHALRARFERFWADYPRKVGKDAAFVAWLRRAPDEVLTEAMIAKVREQRTSPEWRDAGGRYIPHPRTWLSQGRWQDEPLTSSLPASPDARGHVPPCRTNTECNRRWQAEIAARNGVPA